MTDQPIVPTDSAAYGGGRWRRALRRRGALWIGFLAVLLPLIVLMVLQYLWLTDLERNSAIARQATLDNYLEALDKEVRWFYGSQAERALNLPSHYFDDDYFAKIGYYFKKKKPEGARRLFVVDMTDSGEGELFFYHAEDHCLKEPKFTSEASAVYAAVAPWKVLTKKDRVVKTVRLSVDERDPDNRIILNPITDENDRLTALAGMIVDREFFEREVLPEAIKYAFHSFAEGEELMISVRDEAGSVVVSGGEELDENGDQHTRPFSFVFKDWEMGLSWRSATPEQLARASFAYNVTLSGVLSLVLLGGVALALRTASREMTLSDMKNDFVSNVSHELRTPLSSIRVFAEFMRLGRVKEERKVLEYGEYIETESRRLTQLIDNILDFSKIESGQKIYHFEVTDVSAVVEGALKMFEVRLKHSGFDIDYQEPVGELPLVRIDPGAIGQALCNLLDNAVKYSGDSREIRVALRRQGSRVAIAITDYGIGISEEEQAQIFDRFHRVSTGLVHDVKGSGLGLSIVQHVAQAHDGEVTVESAAGKGSTFTIFLPAAEAADAEAEERAEAVRPLPQSSQEAAP